MNATDLPAPTGTPYAEAYVQAYKAKPEVGERMPASDFLPVHVAPATGWYTVPGFVRVAVWLWALVTVLGFAAGLLFSLVWVIILMVTLGAQ